MSDTTTRIMLATRLDPGVQLNDTYEIDERIASGGMGEVYRGHNIQTGEPVAIKTILPELANQEAIFSLFRKEATVLGRLYHDTIVRYYSFSRDPRLGRPYLAMEFVDGVSLADRLQANPLTPDEVRLLFVSVAEGLALAHKAGVIHRDVSPDNIILRDGDVSRPKLIDFGIARSANFGEGTLIGGGFAGKYNFVSPEQLGLQGGELDARSDIYSLGLVIVASLRGQPIDMGGTHVDVIEKRSRLPDLSDIDESLRPLIEAMLQPSPDNRPASATMVAELLRASRPAEPPVPSANATVIAQPGVPGLPSSPPPAAAQSVPPGQPAISWTTAPRGGTPFATAEPSEPAHASSEAASAAPKPAAGGESPFGSAAAYPAAPLAGSAGPAAQAGSDTPKRKSGAGLYAAVAVLAVAAVGAGGAYMAGLIGPGGQEAAIVGEDTRETPIATSEAASDTGQPATTPDAGDAPAADGGQQPEQVARIEEPGTTPPDATQPAASPGPSTTEAGGGPAPPSEQPPVATEPTPGETAVGPEKETQEAAAALTKMIDVGVSWLHQYDGGKCFFIAVSSVTSESIAVKGFGPDVASFRTMYDSFMKANGIEPEVNGHLITESQCAAAEFLKAVQPGAKDSPRLTLGAERVKIGDTLTVSVDNTEGKVLDLLLVGDDGLVYNVKSLGAQTINNGKMTFEMWLGGLHIEEESPEMVIALTSKSGLEVPQGKDHARATALFLKLARQIRDENVDVGVDFAYFRASP